MKFLIGFILGCAVGILSYHYFMLEYVTEARIQDALKRRAIDFQENIENKATGSFKDISDQIFK